MNHHFIHNYYRVAGHIFSLNIQEGFLPEVLLESYEPFIANNAEKASPLFSLAATSDIKQIPPPINEISCLDDNLDRLQLFYGTGGRILLRLAVSGRPVCCHICSDINRRNAIIYLTGITEEFRFGLNNKNKQTSS